MILEGNQRGGAKDLALHLLKDDNDHVEVHELRGFVSDNLMSALNEAYAISRGTKAKQFLYSLSLNPPANENVNTADFIATAEKVEKKLGLDDQPRAIVFHEKKGRRHAHVVWSRIKASEMKAIQLPYTKLKLREISRELYLQHGWKMPQGFINSALRDPKNFTMAQWQQAKRIGKDPRQIKETLQDCWALSNDLVSFEHALKERGYWLAKGDRRAFVVLDHRCEVFAVSKKWFGISIQEAKERLGETQSLKSVEEVKAQIAQEMSNQLNQLHSQQQNTIHNRLEGIHKKHLDMVERHKKERLELKKNQRERWHKETVQRQKRFNRGLMAVLDWFTGKQSKIKRQNKREVASADIRDQLEKDELMFCQLDESRKLQTRIDRLNAFEQHSRNMILQDIGQYQQISIKKINELRPTNKIQLDL